MFVELSIGRSSEPPRSLIITCSRATFRLSYMNLLRLRIDREFDVRPAAFPRHRSSTTYVNLGYKKFGTSPAPPESLTRFQRFYHAGQQR